MRHVYECPMRWADLDMLGHVNNVVYVDYLQEARVDMLRVHQRNHAGNALTEGTVVVRHEVSYRAPLGFRFRPVKIECWVTEIRAATFTMAYEVFHDDGDDGRGGLPARDDRALAVRLRRRAPAPADGGGEGGAERLPRADRPPTQPPTGSRSLAPSTAATRSTSGSPTSTSTATSTT